MSYSMGLGYAASLVMGLALGLTGGGGSILTVPILVYLFGIVAVEATGYSLALVGLVSAWGAWGAYKSKDLELKTGLIFGIPGILGVLFSRGVLVKKVPEMITWGSLSLDKNSLLLVAFSIIMLLAASTMIRAGLSDPNKQGTIQKVENSSMRFLKMIFGGGLVGIVAGFVGAGGGFLIVPALATVGALPMRRAVGTSLMIIALQSLLGILGDFSTLSKIDYKLFITILILAVVGMTTGTRLRSFIPQNKLKLGFGIFVLVMGIFVLAQELTKGNV